MRAILCVSWSKLNKVSDKSNEISNILNELLLIYTKF